VDLGADARRGRGLGGIRSRHPRLPREGK
jgi:hypothetical protein